MKHVRNIRLAASAVMSVGVVAGVLMATGSGASAAPSLSSAGTCAWTARALPSLIDGGFAQIQGTDGDTTWVGIAQGADHTHAVLWRHGRIVELAGLPGSTYSAAADVNRRGVTVGFSGGPDGYGHAVEWRNGRLTRLAEPAGALDSQATGINDAGLIVGWATLADSYIHPVVWPADRPGQARVLASTPGEYTYLNGVSETGVLAGVQTPFADPKALTGTVRTGLRPLTGTVPGAFTSAAAAAGRYVVGYQFVLDAPEQSGAVSWQDGRPTLLPGTEGIDPAGATAVNTAGLVAGGASGTALVWQHGQPSVLPPAAGGQHAGAAAVSEDGTVGGWSGTASTNSSAALWSCR
jgi:uncharacterized membrane protein